MELQGEQLIHASREQVWVALNDPDTLMRCIPGCEDVQRISETELQTRMLAKIGPVRARFGGHIRMSDIVVNQRCRIAFEGDGGAAGTARGASEVVLSDDGSNTCLRYTVQAAVGGKLGQIGGRLINASAKKLADEFFEALNAKFSPMHATTDPAQDAHGDAMPRIEQETRQSTPSVSDAHLNAVWTGELQRLVWLGLGIGLGFVIGRLMPI